MCCSRARCVRQAVACEGTAMTNATQPSGQGTVVAVDAGGTRTRAVLVGQDGECLAVALAGPGNPISAGPEAWTTVQRAVAEVMAARSRDLPAPRMLVIAMAGNARATADDSWRSFVQGAGGEGEDGGSALEVAFESDVLSAFCSGSAERHGYLLLAGTGAVAARVTGGRLDRVADGAGWLLGDAGSGFWLGRRVARAVIAELDGRGPATMLTELVYRELGCVPPAPGLAPSGGFDIPSRPLLEHVYQRRPVALAAWAPLALQAAAVGDAVAGALLAEAASELLRSLHAVWQTGQRDADVVLAGGLLGSMNALAEQVIAGLPSPRWVTVPDGLAGAALLALRRAGWSSDTAVLRRLQLSLAALRAGAAQPADRRASS